MKILEVSVHFSPSVGGVETHLNDLNSALLKRRHKVFVLTYQPLMTRVSWKFFEKKDDLSILRIPWIPGFFYRLVSKPLLEFLYLSPALFIVFPFVFIWQKSDVIHTHGLIAGFLGVFWGKIFGKKVITTTHSLYNFPGKGLYRKFAFWIFNNSNCVLTLSKQSANEIEKLGVNPSKIKVFTYWIDLDKFKSKYTKFMAKKKLKLENKFVALFVGRLVEEKGVLELLKAVKIWNKKINLVVIGTGPLENKVKNRESEIKNIVYLGKVDNDNLPIYYNAADVVIVPSTHEEGFGRVILESLALGTPVIASNRGAIPEAMDKSVGKLIRVTPENIKDTVEYFYKNQKELKRLSKNARRFVEKRYSEKNAETIIQAYINNGFRV